MSNQLEDAETIPYYKLKCGDLFIHPETNALFIRTDGTFMLLKQLDGYKMELYPVFHNQDTVVKVNADFYVGDECVYRTYS